MTADERRSLEWWRNPAVGESRLVQVDREALRALLAERDELAALFEALGRRFGEDEAAEAKEGAAPCP